MHLRDPSASEATITVGLRAFARYEEILGIEHAILELSPGATVGDAVSLLRTTAPNGDQLPPHPLVAIDLEQVRSDHVLADGDELALLPPLAGG